MLHGVPIGTVDLEILGEQGLGTLIPLPAYRSVRPHIVLTGALGPKARVELLTRRADDIPSHPVIAKASRAFDLVDRQGTPVPTDAVRLVELRTRAGVTVLVDLRTDPVGEMAAVPTRPRGLGGDVPLEHTGATTDTATAQRNL